VETEQALPEWSISAAENADNGDDACLITHYDPQRVDVQTRLTRPGLLVLGEAWFPGWKAIVSTRGETREVPIYRTNRVLRGVWLPAGEQSVEFRFQPQSFSRGAAISTIGWFLIAILGIVGVVRRSVAR
jgi:uncharacterized membrane protein YfhO